ncbi:MAG: AAA domain-containing protein, partial [Bradyrhizobium sp.]
PEAYHDRIISVLEQDTAGRLVHPLLALLDQPLRASAYSAIESAFEIETDLTAILTHPLVEQLPAALNTLAIKGDDGALQKAIGDFFNEAPAREQLKSFFDGFAAADAWQEIKDLYGLTRLGDNLQLYLYLCDLRFGGSLYPVIYLPVTVTQREQSTEFHLELDSHLYVNKRAVDYAAQEVELPPPHCTMYGVDDRIVYLEPGASPVGQIDKILAKLQSLFDLDRRLTLTEQVGMAQSSRVRLSTAAYFAIFDRSDEALLNDYEALLTELNSGQPEVGALFEKIVHGLLIDEPVDASHEIRQLWDNMPIPDRLLTESPIPLNEEQRKILAALNNPKVNYVAVQGPPGTGKSHTITAIAFEAILSGKTVLILSDKTEALDVVEDKLTTVINRVRPDAKFRNPILRLGRTAGTYAKLLSHAAIGAIEDQLHAARAKQKELDENIHGIKERLAENIGGTIEQLTSIKLADIEAFQKLEAAVGRHVPELVAAIEKGPRPDLKEQLDGARAWRKTPQADAAVAFLENANPTTAGAAIRLMRKASLGSDLSLLAEHRNACSLFRTLRPSDARTLQQFVLRYDALRMPLFGYLFRRGKVRALNAEVGQTLEVVNFIDLHQHLKDLRLLCELVPKAEAVMRAHGAAEDEFAELYEEIIHYNRPYPDYAPLLQLIRGLGKAVAQWELPGMASWTIGKDGRFVHVGEFVGFCMLVASLIELWRALTAHEAQVPVFDLVAERDELEQLCAAKMTFVMDDRFLNFVKQSAATATTLNTVIRTRQKFPTDTFERLRDAFPCIIAGIREFAEYIPLQQDIFDLVVIDEASQVSVAQAFPALLRAKKAVVLGDKQQFSNVKSAYASNERNTAYVSDIKDYFRRSISSRAELLVRASQFDVKKSILEFFELIRNFDIMLRKHFRGYQELISFSSE